jgi:hypothetical protein
MLDSLIEEVTLSNEEAFHFDIAPDGSALYFGREAGVEFEIHEIVLHESSSRIVAIREGAFRSISCYPDGQSLLVAYQRSGGPVERPHGYFEEISIDDGDGNLLDATIDRVSRYGFLRVVDGVASPFDDEMFVYTAGTFSSDGGYTATELWLFRKQ